MLRFGSVTIYQRLLNLLMIVGVLLAFLPQPSLAQELPGPTLWLKFDETAGATLFADNGSSATNGSCVGAACPVAGATGRLGRAAQFDGVDDRVTVTRNVPAGSFSLSGWVRTTPTGTIGARSLNLAMMAPGSGLRQEANSRSIRLLSAAASR